MVRVKQPQLSSVKLPKQARSKQMVADILEAAVRVLSREGARRFTTTRVAELAGVSVGSLYQYFPNKESLLFRLQADEWQQTGAVLAAMLRNPRYPPLQRYRRTVLAFFRSELEEAALRGALDDASALIRDAPETRAFRAEIAHVMDAFMAEALPNVRRNQRAFAAVFLTTSLASVAERITKQPISRRELDAWAGATADMHCRHLENLAAHR